MADTYTLISSVTVGAGGASSIDFTSIPATYTDLLVKFSLRSTHTNWVNCLITLNSSTSSFSNISLEGSGAAASSQSFARYLGTVGGTNVTASTFSNGELYIPNYAGSTNKSFSDDHAPENNATTAYMTMAAGLWSNTAAITSISIAGSTANLAQYSTAYLYGISNS